MDNIEPHEHVAQAKKLDHPFTCPPDLPLDLQFSAELSGTKPVSANQMTAEKWERLQTLAEKCKPLDEDIRSRMCKSVKIAAGTMRLGLLSTLIAILKWPDWQLPSLFTRGFKVAGLVEASNIFSPNYAICR